MKSDFYWLHFAKRKGVYDSFLSDKKILLKAYFFALKGRFFADELGIIKIRALRGFGETNGKSRWHRGGRLRRLWRNLGTMGRECSLAV